MQYAEFTKNFYEEHEEINQMTSSDMQDLRNKLGIKVTITLFCTPSIAAIRESSNQFSLCDIHPLRYSKLKVFLLIIP